MAKVEAVDFRSRQLDLASRPFIDQAKEIKSRQTALGRNLPFLTPLGRNVLRLEREATNARILEGQLIDGFRYMHYSPEVGRFSRRTLAAADTIDESLRATIESSRLLPPDERYLAFKTRVATQRPQSPDEYLLNVFDAVCLGIASEGPFTLTVPLSTQKVSDGVYHPSNVKANIIGAYDLLGLPIDQPMLKFSHEIIERHPLDAFGITVDFGFVFDREKVLPEGSEYVPYATLTVSKPAPERSRTHDSFTSRRYPIFYKL